MSKGIFEENLNLNQFNLSLYSLFSLSSSLPCSLPSRGRRRVKAAGHAPCSHRAPSLAGPDASRPLHAALPPCAHAEDCRRRATATNEPSSAVHQFPSPLAPSPGSPPSLCFANGPPPSPSTPLPAPSARPSFPRRPEPPPPTMAAAAP